MLRSRILTIRGATALCDVHTATMSERLQTVLVRRTTAKRRITNIASRFSMVLTDDNACQTVHDLWIDMRNALETFRAVDDQLRPLLEAAEANALPTDKPIMSRTVTSLHFTKALATRAWRRHEQQWLTSSGNGRGRCWKPPSMLSPAVLNFCRGRHSIACEGLHVVSTIPLPSG